MWKKHPTLHTSIKRTFFMLNKKNKNGLHRWSSAGVRGLSVTAPKPSQSRDNVGGATSLVTHDALYFYWLEPQRLCSL